MAEFEVVEFLWNFPVCVLATNFTRDPNRGILLDDKIRFVSPEVTPGVQSLAVFTDLDLAEDFRDRSPHREALTVVPLSAEAMLKVLRKFRQRFETLVIDPNRTTGLGRVSPIADVIETLENHLRGGGQQENPSSRE